MTREVRDGPGLGAGEIVVLVLGGLLLTGFVTVDGSTRHPPPPDFGSMDVDPKKQAFFAYLEPIVTAINAQFSAELAQVRALRLQVAAGEPMSWSRRRFIRRLARRLEVDVDALDLEAGLEVLERRTGTVPASLVLVQAAVESGWGSSRFAVEGNNYFGQRCYADGCGLVPDDRPDGADFFVASFESPAESVRSYMLNLNTHESYLAFRELRKQSRDDGEPLTGLALVEGLTSYSERGQEYVEQIASMIRDNDLE